MTMKAISIENATLISTTRGMPRAPVAASTRPFSSDMKPMTWLTALRRVTIISRPSSTTDSANDRSSRTNAPAASVTGSITITDSATSPMPRQHRRTDADDALERTVDAKAHDDAVQGDRNDHALEHAARSAR